MSKKTFIAACKFTESRDERIEIGGGEPTLHPMFWEFLGIAQRYQSEDCDMPVWLATNGGVTDTALALAKLAKLGGVAVRLSQDKWHKPIDPRVVQAFKNANDTNPRRASITYDDRRTADLIPAGRAKKNGWGKNHTRKCPCNTLFVSPNGRFWACGCKKMSFGTVFDPHIPTDYIHDECYTGQPQEVKDELIGLGLWK